MRKIGDKATGTVIQGPHGLRSSALPTGALEFLIANLELEFTLKPKKSAKYKFLIANISRFLIAVSVVRRAF
jgi:hypothetical protein